MICKAKSKNNVWHFVIQQEAFPYKKEKLQECRWSSPTTPKQRDLPLLPPAITDTISHPKYVSSPTPPSKFPESKEHPKLLCSLTAALHGAIYKLTPKSPPTPPIFLFLSFNQTLPQIPLIHSLCFSTSPKDMDRRVHNQGWKDLGKPLTKTIWKPPLRHSTHSRCVFKTSRT